MADGDQCDALECELNQTFNAVPGGFYVPVPAAHVLRVEVGTRYDG